MKIQALPCYCATLRQAARAATTVYEAALAGSGIPLTQYTMLQVLKTAPGLTTTEIAEVIGIDQTTATRTLALVRSKKLLSGKSGADRRERRWWLSPLGEKTFSALQPKWEAAQAAWEHRLGQYQAATLKKAAFHAAQSVATA